MGKTSNRSLCLPGWDCQKRIITHRTVPCVCYYYAGDSVALFGAIISGGELFNFIAYPIYSIADTIRYHAGDVGINSDDPNYWVYEIIWNVSP